MKKKKKRNGFTLMEILAVIVVLTIIILIAIPIVMNVIASSRKSSLSTSAYSLIEAAKVYKSESGGAIDAALSFDLTNTMALEYDGMIPDEGKMILLTDGQVGIIAKKWDWCAIKTFDATTVTVYDRDSEDCFLGVNEDIKIVFTPTSPDGNNGWYKNNINGKLEYEVSPEYLPAGYEYAVSYDGGTTFTEYQTLEVDEYFTISEDSEDIVVKARFIYEEGLTTQEVTATAKLDTTPPVAIIKVDAPASSIGQNGWYVGDFTISSNSIDETSGIDSENLNPTTITGDTSGTEVVLTVRDKAGNVSEITQTFKKDTTPPTNPTGGTTTGGKGTGTGSTDPESGLDHYEYYASPTNTAPTHDSSGWTEDGDFSSRMVCEQPLYIWVRAVNGAGLYSDIVSLGSAMGGACCSTPAAGTACAANVVNTYDTCTGTRKCMQVFVNTTYSNPHWASVGSAGWVHGKSPNGGNYGYCTLTNNDGNTKYWEKAYYSRTQVMTSGGFPEGKNGCCGWTPRIAWASGATIYREYVETVETAYPTHYATCSATATNNYKYVWQ